MSWGPLGYLGRIVRVIEGNTRRLDYGSYELQSIFRTDFNGHGFLKRDSFRDYTKLQGEP